MTQTPAKQALSRTWAATKEWIRRFVDWLLAELEVRCGVIVANARLTAYVGGKSLEAAVRMDVQAAANGLTS